MLNNNFSKNGRQKIEEKSAILIKSILAAIYVVLFGSVAFLAILIKWGVVPSITNVFLLRADTLLEGAKELFYNTLSPYFIFIFPLFFLLTWGFYQGIRKKKKYLFIYPSLIIIILSIPFFFIGFSGNLPVEAIGIIFVLTLLMPVCCLFFSLITSFFLYFKKEYLLFIIGAIILAILFVWGIRLAEYSMKTTDPKICETFSLMDSGRLRNLCVKELANRTNNIELCGLSYQNNESCIVDFAIRENDPDLCKKVVSSFTKADQNDCYGAVAAATKNLELCETLSASAHSWCIEAIAIDRQDPELCKKIKDDYSQNRCIERVSGHY